MYVYMYNAVSLYCCTTGILLAILMYTYTVSLLYRCTVALQELALSYNMYVYSSVAILGLSTEGA